MPVYLRNELLNVEIGEPGELYSGSRFDHSGNIMQVTLNNQHTFCTTEKRIYHSKCGFGLINEFDIDGSDGYTETVSGDFFLKTGVGELKKEEDQPYDFFFPYFLSPASFNVETVNKNRIIFETQSPLINGYQTQFKKQLSIDGNVLIIDYLLKNLGLKSFSTEEYCHNFLSIDHQDVSQDYTLKFNFNLYPDRFGKIVDPDNIMMVEEDKISFSGIPHKDIFIASLNGKAPIKAKWELVNSRSNVGVSEEGSLENTKINLWGNSHVISPELFVILKLNPGEDACWNRKFTFFEL